MNYNFDCSTGEYTPLLRDNYKIPIRLGHYTKIEECKPAHPHPISDLATPDMYNSPLSDVEREQHSLSLAEKVLAAAVPPAFLQSGGVKRHIEAPKTIKSPKSDGNYPAELRKLMKPFICDLCGVKMNSPVSARDHYDSRNHSKKVNGWLKTHAEKNGEPIPKLQKFDELGHDGRVVNSTHYADVVGLSVRRSHHPTDKSGQNDPADSPSGRFGIGKAFNKAPSSSTADETDNETYCSLCNIYVTCKSQLITHLNGSKHAKKLKAAGAPPIGSSEDTILASLNKPNCSDRSIHRTPSGQYYCQPCNITADNESLFMQHIKGKKHAKKNKDGAEKKIEL